MGRLVFATSTEVLRVPADAVVFVSADGNYSALTTADGEDFVLTMQLGQIEKRLAEMLDGNDNRFIRIGKSLIVNREYIILLIRPGRNCFCRTAAHSDGKCRRPKTPSRHSRTTWKRRCKNER